MLAQLPKEAVGASSLGLVRARLDGAMDRMYWWEAALPTAGVWN